MGQKKQDKPHALALPMTVLLLLACLCLLASAAWARYRYQQSTDMLFAPKTASQVYLYGAEENGIFTPIPTDFTDTAGGQTLQFLVSNGETKDVFAEKDQYVTVRLYTSLSLGKGENLSAVLTVDGKQYTAVVRRLDAGSPICETFGEGWEYCFVDAEGSELQWILEGEKLSTIEMSLVVDADTGLDSSLFRLMATAHTY